jgi:glycosyltransferase involved in cell wall biosynthesis
MESDPGVPLPPFPGEAGAASGLARHAPPLTDQPLDLSVILSTHNQAALLEETLAHLAVQQVGALQWELIVIDNGSTDRTPDLLRASAARLPLVALQEPVRGKNRAMNRALSVARGELLLFTDDDVVPDAYWIAQMQRAATAWPEHIIFGGQTLLAHPANAPAWIRQVVGFDVQLGRFSFLRPEGPIHALPAGPNYAVRARALRSRRFDESIGPGTGRHYAMGSETELVQRIVRETNRHPLYVPTAVVQHVVRPHQLTARYLCGRMFRAGRGKVRLRTRRAFRPLLGAPRHLWREAALAAANVLRGLTADPATRLRSAVRLAFMVGCLHEYRSEARGRAQASPVATTATKRATTLTSAGV